MAPRSRTHGSVKLVWAASRRSNRFAAPSSTWRGRTAMGGARSAVDCPSESEGGRPRNSRWRRISGSRRRAFDAIRSTRRLAGPCCWRPRPTTVPGAAANASWVARGRDDANRGSAVLEPHRGAWDQDQDKRPSTRRTSESPGNTPGLGIESHSWKRPRLRGQRQPSELIVQPEFHEMNGRRGLLPAERLTED
jgi:hypothetical protein